MGASRNPAAPIGIATPNQHEGRRSPRDGYDTIDQLVLQPAAAASKDTAECARTHCEHSPSDTTVLAPKRWHVLPHYSWIQPGNDLILRTGARYFPPLRCLRRPRRSWALVDSSCGPLVSYAPESRAARHFAGIYLHDWSAQTAHRPDRRETPTNRDGCPSSCSF